MGAGDGGAGSSATDPADGMTDATHVTHVIDVAIVDNDAITLQALRALLERTDGLRVPWTACSGRDAFVACLTDERWPDVLLLDAELGDVSGMEVCRRLRAADERTGILIVTAYPVECFAAGSARAGAQGIVGKADYPWLVSAIRAVAAGRTFSNPRVPTGAMGVGPTHAQSGMPTDDDDLADDSAGSPPDGPIGVRSDAPRWEPAATACRRVRAEEAEAVTRRGSSRNRDAADTLSHQEAQVLRLSAEGLTQKEIAERLGITAASVRTHSSRARRKLDARTLVQAVAEWVRRERG